MSLAKDLAARLRQSVQGCTLHLHGPIQAWVEITRACHDKKTCTEEVARIAVESSKLRIAELIEKGVSKDDPRIVKEELTKAFIKKLLA